QYLVSDESEQCTEGDHMIALTLPSIRAVTLLGDPLQLSTTVFSQNSNNENANYHGRSFMERLGGAGYPSSVLLTNYRCHPDILDPFNQIFYDGRLRAAEANYAPERVGNAWDSFTASRHHFYNF